MRRIVLSVAVCVACFVSGVATMWVFTPSSSPRTRHLSDLLNDRNRHYEVLRTHELRLVKNTHTGEVFLYEDENAPPNTFTVFDDPLRTYVTHVSNTNGQWVFPSGS